jgi:hypothetical protein
VVGIGGLTHKRNSVPDVSQTNQRNSMEHNPTIIVSVYGWDYCITQNGSVLSKNDSKNLPWAERRGREMEITDSHLGAIRNLISNIRGIFPEKAPVLPKAEPLQPAVRPSAMQPV